MAWMAVQRLSIGNGEPLRHLEQDSDLKNTSTSGSAARGLLRRTKEFLTQQELRVFFLKKSDSQANILILNLLSDFAARV